jgi:hypothetical protein
MRRIRKPGLVILGAVLIPVGIFLAIVPVTAATLSTTVVSYDKLVSTLPDPGWPSHIGYVDVKVSWTQGPCPNATSCQGIPTVQWNVTAFDCGLSACNNTTSYPDIGTSTTGTWGISWFEAYPGHSYELEVRTPGPWFTATGRVVPITLQISASSQLGGGWVGVGSVVGGIGLLTYVYWDQRKHALSPEEFGIGPATPP